MQRRTDQGHLLESFIGEGLGQNERLERIEALLDWGEIEAQLSGIYASGRGRPSYPLLSLFKALLLQQWYGLSDPGLEEALSDRLSFRRFVGLGLDDGTPDHSTLSRFRKELRRKGAGSKAFEAVVGQLEARGLMLKAGTLIDASLVKAQAKAPRADKGLGRRGEVDGDASWTRAKGKGFYGYKYHVGVDSGSGLIRRMYLSDAKTAESDVAEALIVGDEAAVYADRGYESKVRRRRLRALGIKDRIMHRSHKYQARLPYWQQRRNVLIARRRAPVEGVFGTLKRSYGYVRVRYFSLAANEVQAQLLSIAFNLRRAERLVWG